MVKSLLVVQTTALLLGGWGANMALATSIHYTADSVSDGVTGAIVGGPESTFELYGVGYIQQATTLYIGLNTNLPIGGFLDPQVAGGSIAWGDLFLNFSELPFTAAVAAGQVYGIRFDAANDSFVPQLGLYQVLQTSSVSPFNDGFQSLTDYQQVVQEAGGTPAFGAIAIADGYLNSAELPQNIIAQGNLLSTDIEFISDFSAAGFATDFGFNTALPETGNHTYGFSIDTTNLPTGQFIAHLLAECANDGIAFVGELFSPESTRPEAASVPEPASGLVLLAIGFAYIASRPRIK